MAVTLTPTLTAHQAAARRLPAISVEAQPRRFDVPVLRWARWYTGAEADAPHAATVAADGSLVRVRNAAGTLYASRVANPASGSTYSAWTSLGACHATAGVAIAASAAELTLVYVDAAGTGLQVRHSADNGASWGAATTRVTEASAIGSVAVACKSGSADLCAFYTLGTTTTLKRLRRTAGVWEGAGTTWSRSGSVASLSGLSAAYHSSNYILTITGTEVTTLHPRVWGALMGDGGFPANIWSSLATIAEADAASTSAFAGPSIVPTGTLSAPIGAFARKETGAVAVNRAYTTAVAFGGSATSPWTEPHPHDATSAYGLALASYAGVTYFACTTSGVWAATCPASGDELGHRLLELNVDARWGGACRATLTLENADGTLPGGSLFVGAGLRLRPGYASGTGGAAEYGADYWLTVRRVRSSATERTVTIEADGPLEALDRWISSQAWNVSTGALARGTIALRLAGRAGVTLASANAPRAPSADWSATGPAFAVPPAQSGAQAVDRLLSVLTDHLRLDAGTPGLEAFGCTTADASDWTLGGAGHPVASFVTDPQPPASNWIRLQGASRYADAFDQASVSAHGPRMRHVRNLDAGTDAKASAYASAALRRQLLAAPAALARCPAHCGVQVGDVVTFDSANYRVSGVRIEYVRDGKTRRFVSQLSLGSL